MVNLEKVTTGAPINQNNDYNKKQQIPVNKIAIKMGNEKQSASQNEEVINVQEVKTVVSQMNEFIDPLRTDLKFVFHEQLKEYYVTVVNPLTNEVIKEIPPKRMLDMYAEMTEFMGILVDEKI